MLGFLGQACVRCYRKNQLARRAAGSAALAAALNRAAQRAPSVGAVVRARRGVGTHWQPSQVWVVATAVNGGGGGGGGGGEGGEGAEGCGHALAASKYSLNT